MVKKTVVSFLTAVALIGGISGYLVADTYDLVPGFLTFKEPEFGKPLPEREKVQAETILPAQMRTELPSLKNSDLLPIWKELEASTGGKWNAGAYVIDATTGNIVFAANEKTPVVPASTTKLYTAYATLKSLDPQSRLATRLYQEGDTLHLIGEGDLLLSPGKGNSQEIDGYAGLEDLVTQASEKLKTASVKPTKLVLHTQLHEGPALDPTIREEYRVWISPQTAFAFKAGATFNGYDQNPTNAVGNSLADLFAKYDLPLEVSYQEQAFVVQDQPLVAEVHSATILQITRIMLERSDNTLAEHLCRLAAKAESGASTPQAAYTQLVETVKKLPIPHDGFEIKSCSGLTEENRIAPQTTAEFLYHLWAKGNSVEKQIFRMNPVSGFSGTLLSRLNTSVTAGRVQAKTGLMDSAAALSGVVVTRTGRPLIFHVQTAGVPEAAYATRVDLDAFIEALVNR
ncbi:D-alanyl-D-alanine carboxypeptidase [Gleimia sp. 6138-11-ORH1]|uniref:D-alanyl-D-alanine carboxypeptidase n=1 Tax=Gleimia sp. 6138-11-ORH1 TaxID=2973937 RepID=UPI002167AF07|nr:D-alanyl-D-alanine carboxypeptidase [Gleimia sp. 6138-11-ORH1]MCS4484675.1 D-alanyl-D-alanine carboxypeptidase [Gleimia sp. 6138-11-ORH1]